MELLRESIYIFLYYANVNIFICTITVSKVSVEEFIDIPVIG